MRNIAIIGGGAAGALAAANLLRRAHRGDRLIVIEPAAELGRGLAYSAPGRSHLLNLWASDMSAYTDKPNDFVGWLADRNSRPSEELAQTCAVRFDYGTYLENVLKAAILESEASFQHVSDRAIRIGGGVKPKITTFGGRVLFVDTAVLAIGYFPPSYPPQLEKLVGHPRFMVDPWASWLEAIQEKETVFLLGTGSAMVDAVLSLRAQGHLGPIVARSRTGLIPKQHCPTPAIGIPDGLLETHPFRRSVVRFIRQQGDDWRGAIDALLPHLDDLWLSLSWDDRCRYRRRLRPFWDRHFFRMPEAVSATISSLRTSGQLDVKRGLLKTVEAVDSGFEVDLSGHWREAFKADWIVNCTGSQLDVRIAKVPILESAVKERLAVYDPLGLGLLVDRDGRTEPEGRLWALGNLCRGCRWETNSIPQIRVQAERLAECIYPE